MTTDEILSRTVLNSWKLVIDRFSQAIAPLSDEQLERPVAVERLHPELDEAYITRPDRALPDPVSGADLKRAWSEVNSKLTSAFETYSPEKWLQKHTAVSDEDFAKDPTRNRLAVVMSRTNHASFHTGQVVLTK